MGRGGHFKQKWQGCICKNMQDTCVETTRSSLCLESKETVAISNAGQVTG